MALAAKLVMRQGQSMVLTPQLLQAIKLLQLPTLELSAFIKDEIERNPLLEMDAGAPPDSEFGAPAESGPSEGLEDWASEGLETDPAALAANLGTEIANAFDSHAAGPATPEVDSGASLSMGTWNGASGEVGAEGFETNLVANDTLADHLRRQAAPEFPGARGQIILSVFIDALDEAGYLVEPLETLANRLGLAMNEAEACLKKLHGLEPTGVFARTLAECLALQLIERDRYDPAMRALVENLPMLAKRDYSGLRRVCGVDAEDLSDMVKELRRLDPKPARSFGAAPADVTAPDVLIAAASDNSWRIELNAEALPRVLVNETYAARIKRRSKREEDRIFVTTQLQSAHWLVKSVEQRARTILSVATEIVRRQDAFFADGVSGLRPMTLKAVADAIGVHESTVSRAASNKTMLTPRGLFEMKYFFTNAIAATDFGEAHSAASVRHRIKQIVDSESPRDILSDDVIVQRLSEAGVVVARRTVAKYRESLRIPSSVERRRQKMTPPGGSDALERRHFSMGSLGAREDDAIDSRLERS